MCGIAGIHHFAGGGEIDPGLLVAMTDILTHRGPDDSGVWIGPGIGLGQRRLAIVDLSPAGRNPMPNEDESLWLTYNGEIYNVLERREELAARGHRFRSHTDSEMLLHLYEERGLDFVHELRGMFAIALWDGPRRTLVVVRDRLGIKPLYWRAAGGTFAFASELKGLLADPACPRAVNPEALAAYLRLGYVPSPLSMLDGVHKLAPGNLLVVTKDGVETRRYWSPPVGETTALSVEDATAELRRLLEESVRLRFMSDVPLGAFLSGGIDSSIVCALMARLMDRPVKTFAIGFAGAAEDERVHARVVAAHIGAEHHEFVVEPDALTILPDVVWHLDEPLADPSALPTWAVSEMARGHVTVALSGDGGDETFAGYETYRLAQAYGALGALPGGLLDGLAGLANGIGAPASVARRLGRARQDALLRHIDLMALCDVAGARALLAPGVAALVTPDAGLGAARREAGRFAPRDLRRLLHLDLTTWMTDDVLAKVDRMSMAHALEVRVPLLDHVLVEFGARLPFDYKLRGGVSKWLLKRAAADLLPPSILARGKQGFGVPLTRWFGGDFDRVLAERLSPAALARRPELDAHGVAALVARATQGGLDAQGLRPLWAILVHVLWAETFLDRPLAKPATRSRLVAATGRVTETTA
jgi:asparagine synthase (glutamine-hydrolysing)